MVAATSRDSASRRTSRQRRRSMSSPWCRSCVPIRCASRSAPSASPRVTGRSETTSPTRKRGIRHPSLARRAPMRVQGMAEDKKMDKIVALCKRRGFLFQGSEIYGGLNGFWDYGPLGVELKRNVKEVWWRDMVTGHDNLNTLPGAPGPYEMVGLDCAIIMHPQVWKCSGHYDLFHDIMVDCRETNKRYRYDQVVGRWAKHKEDRVFVTVLPETDHPEQEIEAKALK